MQLLEPVNYGSGVAPSKNLELGLVLLKRLVFVCEESMMETVLSTVDSCLKSKENWLAGMAAIVAISEVSQVTIKPIDQLLSLVLSPVRDPNPQVRWATTDSIWRVYMNLGPNINERCQDRILVALSALIEDSHQRVLLQAAQAICDFSQVCTPNMLSPFLNVIVTQLLKLLKSQSQRVREVAFAALISLASSSKDRFSICFKAAMDTLLGILDTKVYACERLVCANCLFCISCIALAVGKERFHKYVVQVVGAIRSLAVCVIKTDHKMKVLILQAVLNFCRCLGKDFSVSESGVRPLLHELASEFVPEVGARAHLRKEEVLAYKVMEYCASELKENQVISTEKVQDIIREAPKTNPVSCEVVGSYVPPQTIQHHQPSAPTLREYHNSNGDKDRLEEKERGQAEIDMFSLT
ncbi:hypothetical protein M0R45_019046 [Rubus argutus]|uniref:Maestro/Maestro-like HEAT-repeats domain-containing protein n=1 Tax=Rubus argutus TaxID=59490 RepID=A0AAW1X508_RUBAR